MSKSLVLGSGYVGSRILEILQGRQHDTTAWTLHEDSANSLRNSANRVIFSDASLASSWPSPDDKYDYVFFCLSTSGGDSQAYRRIHNKALRLAMEHLIHPKIRLVYCSSTSVYGQNDGTEVDELSVSAPSSETSKILIEAEQEILIKGGTVARIGGIYGPGRAFLLKKFLKGEAIMESRGEKWVNQIHREDVANGLIHLSQINSAEGEIYNLTDSTPVQYGTLYKWLSENFSKPMPEKTTQQRSKRRGISNKRVSNRKLLDTGYIPVHPSYRTGYLEVAPTLL
ncbi:MAG: NAD-dependent epimerase/dehydratase family protein [Verrucomicrobiota bacterium]